MELAPTKLTINKITWVFYSLQNWSLRFLKKSGQHWNICHSDECSFLIGIDSKWQDFLTVATMAAVWWINISRRGVAVSQILHYSLNKNRYNFIDLTQIQQYNLAVATTTMAAVWWINILRRGGRCLSTAQCAVCTVGSPCIKNGPVYATGG